MPRFRRSPRVICLCGVAALLGLLSACRGPFVMGGTMRNHPALLVGDWVDSAKSTTADTSVWRLGPSGEDDSFHVMRRADAAFGGTAFETTPARHYGYWYLQGNLVDTSERAICFTNRPGRSAPTCISFQLDTVLGGDRAHRRLLLRGYRGQHHVSDRVLLARVP